MIDYVIINALICTFFLFLLHDGNMDWMLSLKKQVNSFLKIKIVEQSIISGFCRFLIKLQKCNFCISFWFSVLYVTLIDGNLIFCLTNSVLSPIVYSCLKKSLIITGDQYLPSETPKASLNRKAQVSNTMSVQPALSTRIISHLFYNFFKKVKYFKCRNQSYFIQCNYYCRI